MVSKKAKEKDATKKYVTKNDGAHKNETKKDATHKTHIHILFEKKYLVVSRFNTIGQTHMVRFCLGWAILVPGACTKKVLPSCEVFHPLFMLHHPTFGNCFYVW